MKRKKKINFSLPPRPADLPAGVWTEQALKVLAERYLLKDEKLELVETPEDLCWRVAWQIASAEAVWGATRKKVESLAREFYRLLVTHEFLPNSPTLMNAGTDNGLQYSACFVLPVEDSLVGIFDALKYQALIHQTGGGTGFSFSRLRPRGSVVKSSHGTASGPVSFMRIFDAATSEIKQGGKRRGANMGVLRIDHPDILEFIRCKKEGTITNFNISVAVTDRFMEALKGDADYDLINPKNGQKTASLPARQVFAEIVQTAWETGDPGVLFIDRMNTGASNPVPSLGPIESTNPCGEVPLYPFDSCNLGSIFLNYFVENKNINWKKLEKVTKIAVRFMDNVIEINPYILPQIEKTTKAVRRIGLGVGGWADLLVSLRIPYDSEEALKLAEKVMGKIKTAAVAESQKLAKLRGAFPLFAQSIYKNQKPRRNSTLTTIAPTGTISIIAGASSGIEPLFALAYRHIVKDKELDREMTFVNEKFASVAKERGFWSDKLQEKVGNIGFIRTLTEIPEDIRAVFGTAHEIEPVWHVRMQAAFQKYTDNAVSKTINLAKEAKVEDVREAYLLAWETGCKGITIFRDGCKEAQVLNLGVGKTDHLNSQSVGERPFKVTGVTYKLATPVGSAFVTINEDISGNPLEIFINVGKAGSDVAAMAEALGRTLSTSLRFSSFLTPLEKAKELAHQLSGIGGRRSVGFGPNKILSLPDAVSIALSLHYGFRINGNFNFGVPLNGTESVVAAKEIREAGANDPATVSVPLNEASVMETGDICPACGASALVHEEGCSKCHICGHSEC
ncbi:ribonucleoside-diphosphate reductase, adenosylcobalamin-dependent [Candidatus Woesebacteria bacterium CG_4_10_14_0_2_um_filter_44_9]|uniref:Vitamin B12-dependent ribonucleotide reductase n=2 Tax=Candidatus Woeseibacteriota TaxID=1752722 RepID=A0A2M7TIM3_9BACT|nr:MAG: ribonucleoside-diphosphate reductase, adenosylcobalamin-dependent [Candidatus Woesebacteria bacterium CG_4_10_14_0_2_um_filter_44_9]